MFDKNDAKPNAPINVIIGLLIRKEIFSLSDKEGLAHIILLR
jgi:hypothetical protein